MTYPKQSMPIKRPHQIEPATCVDLVHGRTDDILETLIRLRHGANYNDPAAFAYRSYNQVMHSGWSGVASMDRRF
ncbi:cyanobactin biosynthesis system PatB/AcyB/McaB family protein [Calothrix sp. FACHB-156]|nr:cyanobactin biosynthesis system PatB/AcyB/McaB family protein [Calothrix sp. FACHB-156]